MGESSLLLTQIHKITSNQSKPE